MCEDRSCLEASLQIRKDGEARRPYWLYSFLKCISKTAVEVRASQGGIYAGGEQRLTILLIRYSLAIMKCVNRLPCPSINNNQAALS